MRKCRRKRKTRIRCATIMVGLPLCTTIALAQTERRYAIFELPVVSEPLSEAWGINDAGVVVGHSFLPGFAAHAVAWSRRKLFDLGLPDGAALARGFRINSKNEIAGWSIVKGGNPFSTRAIAWKNGRFHDLGTLGGNFAAGYDINDAGQIVGESEFDVDRFDRRAFRWQNGIMTDLGSLGGPDARSGAWGTNRFGQVVGYSWTSSARRATLWENGEIIDLGSLWGEESDRGEATDINDLGQIVGRSEKANLVESRGVLLAMV